MLDKRWRSSYRAGGGLRWSDALTAAGLTLVMLGGMAADSPGDATFWAAGIVVVGMVMAVLGQKLGRWGQCWIGTKQKKN